MQRAFPFLAALIVCAFATGAGAFAQEWRPLFTAKSIDGWEATPAGRTPYNLEDGMLVSQPSSKGMLRYSKEALGDCVIRLVYRMSNEFGNSGVFIRIPNASATEGQAIHQGIEVQIDEQDDEWHGTGALYSMTKVKARPYLPPGAWNTMEITVDGPRTMVILNGVVITDYDGKSDVPAKRKSYEPNRGPRPERGYIGLQNHDSRATIAFKEISVRPLN